jgi:hypothetical protein
VRPLHLVRSSRSRSDSRAVLLAEWVKAKQADIFSKEASARYEKLIAQRRTGDLEGQERADLQTIVQGIPVRYYA